MTNLRNETKTGEQPQAFEFEALAAPRAPWQRPLLLMAPVILISLFHLLALIYLARQHPFGNYATETDFYHFYAPDAERLAAGQFPQNTYQGPGYPAALAVAAKRSEERRVGKGWSARWATWH